MIITAGVMPCARPYGRLSGGSRRLQRLRRDGAIWRGHDPRRAHAGDCLAGSHRALSGVPAPATTFGRSVYGHRTRNRGLSLRLPTQPRVMIAFARAARWRGSGGVLSPACRQPRIDARLSVAVDRRRRARRHLDPWRSRQLTSHRSHGGILITFLQFDPVGDQLPVGPPDHLRHIIVVICYCTTGETSHAVTG